MEIRLPFALALAAASLAYAAVTLMPFSPPDQKTRMEASEVLSAPAELRPMMVDSLYEPLAKHEPGDWIAVHREKSQSVKDYRKSGANFPDQIRKVLYLMPLGEFPKEGQTPSLETLRDYLGLYFSMEAKLAPAVKVESVGAQQRINPGINKPQKVGKLSPPPWCHGVCWADTFCLFGNSRYSPGSPFPP